MTRAAILIVLALAAPLYSAEPAKRRPFMSAIQRQVPKPAVPMPKFDAPEAPMVIGAWLEPTSQLVIHGDYETARKLALAEGRPLVVLSRLDQPALSAAVEQEPTEAVLTIAPDDKRFPLSGVYRYEPKTVKGAYGLYQMQAPQPPKLKAKPMAYEVPTPQDVSRAQGCANGTCKPRRRFR